MEIIKASINNQKDVVRISNNLWNKDSIDELEKEYRDTLEREKIRQFFYSY